MSYGKCNQCIKFGTPKCPTSALCLKYEERPYFEPKEKGRSNMFDEDYKYVVSVIVVIQLLLVVLKLFKVLALSWLLVLSPAIVSAVFVIGFVVVISILRLGEW